MKIIQLFLKDSASAVISDELIQFLIKDGFVQVKYRTEGDGTIYHEYHNMDNVAQISFFEEK